MTRIVNAVALLTLAGMALLAIAYELSLFDEAVAGWGR